MVFRLLEMHLQVNKLSLVIFLLMLSGNELSSVFLSSPSRQEQITYSSPGNIFSNIFFSLAEKKREELLNIYLKTRHIFKCYNICLKPEDFCKSKFMLSKVNFSDFMCDNVKIMKIFKL